MSLDSRNRYGGYSMFPPYVPVAERKAKAARTAAALAKKRGAPLSPVILETSALAKTFWGKSWCKNIEAYRDYENRLPRGRSYVRSGAVIDLEIERGKVTALVVGSRSKPYEITIEIQPLDPARWKLLKEKCTGKISSLLSLVQGKLPPEILQEFCNPGTGLFPEPGEIKMTCSCPDWAGLCKHLAAVLYAIGARLDLRPELFFTLRGIDQNELLGDSAVETLTDTGPAEIAPENISNVFGIEFDTLDAQKSAQNARKSGKNPKKSAQKPSKKPEKPPKAKKRAGKPQKAPRKTKKAAKIEEKPAAVPLKTQNKPKKAKKAKKTAK